MAKINVYFYLFKFVDNNDELIRFKNLHEKGLNGVLTDYFKKITGYDNDKKNEKITCLYSKYLHEYRFYNECCIKSIQTVIKTGEYGIETEIVNSDNGKTNYIQKKNDAQVKPFCFSIYFNDNDTQGIIAMESIGNNKIKKLVTDIFNNAVAESSSSIKIIPVAPKQIARQFFEAGSISEIRLSRFVKFEDKSDAINDMPFKSEHEVISYKKPRITDAGLIERFLTKQTISDVIGIENEYEDMQFVVHIGKSSRNFSFSTLHTVEAYQDVTDTVQKGDNGLPISDSLFSIMDETAFYYLQTLGIVPEDVNYTILTKGTLDRYPELNEKNGG